MLVISILAGLVATTMPSGHDRPEPAMIVEAGPPPRGVYFDHVLVVMMENEGIREICGNSLPCNGTYTPYLSSLANQYSIDQQYTSLITTSEPNYFGVLQASISPCPSNCFPPAGGINAVNLVDRFYGAGISWRGYFENQNKVLGCDGTTHEPYEHEHNGFTAFQDIFFNNTRCLNTVLANPSSNSTCTVTDCALIKDLNSTSAPNFMWLTPNDCNNMHADAICTVNNGYNGCTVGDSSTCKTDGDNYLASLVPNILTSRTFTTTRAALFIVFDEGAGTGCPYNNSSEDCVYAVWAGPVAKTNFHTGTHYNGYSLTKTLEVNWNLTALTANDLNAAPMAEFFKSDFSITSNPVSLTFLARATSNSTVSISSINGFTGTVTLAANSSPIGLSLALNPTSMTVPQGGTGTSILSVTTDTAANYTVTVTGTSGALSHNTTLTIIVQDFTITANPTILKSNRGASTTSTITISAVNHFAGTVTLLSTGTTGLNTSIAPSTINLGSGTATLTVVSSTAGNYTGIVTASSSALTHSVMINVQIVDFTITASQPPTAKVGSTVNSNITIAPVNHFAGTVSISETIPPGLSCSAISPNSLSPPGTATVGCTASNAGNYTLTITGSSGGLSHYTSVVFTITDFTINANPANITVTDSNATSTITITSLNNFAETVVLTTNSTSLCSLTPSNVTGSGTAILSCTNSASSYAVAVTGTDGTVSHTILVLVTVPTGSVGGVILPVDKLGLLWQFLPELTLVLATLVSGIILKRRNKREYSRLGRMSTACSATLAR